MEKITIVVPSLNQEKFIPNLLTSLKRQTFQDFKVLVIDSYSSDNSVKLFKEYEKVEIINLKSTGEQACIHGFNLAKSKYVMNMCTSDFYPLDTWLEDAFEKLEKDNELSMVWSNAIQVNEKGKFTSLWKPEFFISPPPKKFKYFPYWFSDSYLPELNYCVHTKVFQHCISDLKEAKLKYNNIGVLNYFIYNFTKNGYLQEYIPHLGHAGRTHYNQIQSRAAQKNLDQSDDYYLKKLKLTYLKDLILKKETHVFRNSNFEVIKTFSILNIYILILMIFVKKISYWKTRFILKYNII
jgi:glycosyltransferase involved in cell wall biosynthesis